MLRKVLLATVGAALLAGGCLYSDPVANKTPRPTRFQEAEAQYLAKNYAVARTKFLAVAASEAGPERQFAREAQYYAARCDQNLGNFEAAVRVYNRLLDPPAYRSLEIRALVSRGDISMEVRDFSGAAHDYGRARRLLGEGTMIDDIDHGRLTYQLGLAYYSQAVTAPNSTERDLRYADADRCFEEYMKRYPQGRFYEEAKRHQSYVGRAPVTTFYVLVGGNTTVRGQAEALAQRVEARGFKADGVRVFSESLGGTTVYKVRVGACQIRDNAFALQRRLKAAGFSGEVCP